MGRDIQTVTVARTTSNSSMSPFSCALLVLVSLCGISAIPKPLPGGTVGYRGVYPQLLKDKSVDYMSAAMKAANLAINDKIFEDESLNVEGIDAKRGVRQVYVPTFFTKHPQPQQVAFTAPLQQQQLHTRTNRDAQVYELPIFYDAYRPRDQKLFQYLRKMDIVDRGTSSFPVLSN